MPRHFFRVTVNLPASIRNNFNNNEVFNPYAFVRNRLYHFVFHRFCLLYARVFSEVKRKIIEFVILLAALFCFITLVYVHVVFVQTPMTCLEGYRDIWQRNGILRVEVLSKPGIENYTLEDSYWKERTLRHHQFDTQSHFIFTDSSMSDAYESVVDGVVDSADEDGDDDGDVRGDNETNETEGPLLKAISVIVEKESELNKVFSEAQFQPMSEEAILATDPEGSYIMEFSLEYGLLRLRPSKRRDLNISVTFVILDPEVNQCFGGSLNRFLLDNFLGYDNVLLSSIKTMAERKDQKGFVRNAVADIEYIFINNWSNEKSYITAGFVMILFTLTISTLLRHSHHQILVVVGFWASHIVASLERPSNFFDVVWPRNLIPSAGAPVLMVILALVGMEAVMSDFFHDRSIALHVIVIVWFADLYDAICCQSPLSKRHWFRFFYLYHFLFYAYNYKFGGVYWPLTLLTSWIFTVHSMVFFFHHYELPRFLHRSARINVNRAHQHQPPNDNPPQNQEPEPNTGPPPPDAPPSPDATDNTVETPIMEAEPSENSTTDQIQSTENLVTQDTATMICSDLQHSENLLLQISPNRGNTITLDKAQKHSRSAVEQSQGALNISNELESLVCRNFTKAKEYSARDLYKVVALQKSPKLSASSYVGCSAKREKYVKFISPTVMTVN